MLRLGSQAGLRLVLSLSSHATFLTLKIFFLGNLTLLGLIWFFIMINKSMFSHKNRVSFNTSLFFLGIIYYPVCWDTPKKMCFEKSYTFRALPLSVAYFDQRLGVAHSKRWSKSLFLTFFVLKIWKTSKKKEICCKILQKRILFLASSRKMIFLKWIFSNVM